MPMHGTSEVFRVCRPCARLTNWPKDCYRQFKYSEQMETNVGTPLSCPLWIHYCGETDTHWTWEGWQGTLDLDLSDPDCMTIGKSELFRTSVSSFSGWNYSVFITACLWKFDETMEIKIPYKKKVHGKRNGKIHAKKKKQKQQGHMIIHKTCTHFDWVHCPFPRQSFNPNPSRTCHLPRDSESDVFCLLALCVPKAQPLNCFECILSNKGFKSDDWEDDNIPSCLWIFHFYSKTVKMDYVGQVSVFTGLNRRLRRICSQLLFAIQLLPQCERSGAFPPQALVSLGGSERE